ncbi:MAG: peptidyl-prolyl cis-trans isomerase [Myxococcota bacterium]|nr:peptidyl-prolyl cis-trans isomerase [Myxococcota bacterium]
MRRSSILVMNTLMLWTWSLVGCTSDQDKGAEYTLATESSLSEGQKKRVVARIGDRMITLEEFESRLNEKSPFVRARYNSPNRKQEFLDSLIRFELLALEAEKKGYGKDPDVVLAHKQAMVRRFVAEEVAQLIRMKDVTDADMKAYFEAHKSDYVRPAQVRAAHILVKAENTAIGILKQLLDKNSGPVAGASSDFKAWVKRASIDQKTKEKNGDLGFFAESGTAHAHGAAHGSTVPASVAKAAFSLKTNGAIFATPVKSSAGWHIVQRTGFRRAIDQNIAAVKNKIRNAVFREKKRTAMQAYVKSLREKVKVNIDEAVLKAAIGRQGRTKPGRLAPPKLVPVKKQAKESTQ